MLNYDKVRQWEFADVVQTYSQRDTILYALGLGIGEDSLDEDQLRYTYEKNLVAVPTYPVVLGNPGPWMADPRTGIDWVKSLHGEQGLIVFKPIPVDGTIIGRNRVVDVIDKGPGRGALLMMERDVVDQATGELYATRTSTSFLRGDGGFGGPTRQVPRPPEVPSTDPTVSVRLATRPVTPLIYRLSGDYNPVHADPEVARRAGFERPIGHGLCTYGMIGRAFVQSVCGRDPAALAELGGRFSSPVYPGDTIQVDIWDLGSGEFAFRAVAAERGVIVFNNGRARAR